MLWTSSAASLKADRSSKVYWRFSEVEITLAASRVLARPSVGDVNHPNIFNISACGYGRLAGLVRAHSEHIISFLHKVTGLDTQCPQTLGTFLAAEGS